MNPIDFEKTQLFADQAKEIYDAKEPNSSPAVPIPPLPGPAVTPDIKTLTKEEKIALATGGILAFGLGTMVIAGMDVPQDQASPEIAVKPTLPPPAPDTPVIETVQSENHIEPIPEEKQDIPEPKPVRSAATAPGTFEVSHALFRIPEEIVVATDVTDSMPFETAFDAARAEVGPAGLFVWNNTYYGTFRESEWNGLSEEQKQVWLQATGPVIEPVFPEPDMVENRHVIVAERGEITWTGIDKDEDGIAEVLIAHAKGTPPIVMMDTDGDKQLDTRYSLEAGGGVVSAVLEKTSFTLTDVALIPEMERGSVFGSVAETQPVGPDQPPVTILRENGSYVIGIDLNNDKLVDVISLRRDGQSPVVAIDLDDDGQVETSFLYNATSQQTEPVQMEPLQPMTVYEQQETSDALYSTTLHADSANISEKANEEELNSSEENTGQHAVPDPFEDHYFTYNVDSEDFTG